MAQPEEILRNLLEVIAVEQNFDNHEINIKPITSEGANYTSSIFKAKISGQKHADLNLFAKVATLSESLRPQMSADKIFETERFFYTHLGKLYQGLQDKYNVSEEDRLVFPKFYGCNPKYMEETVVLEDLNMKGYGMFDRFSSVDWAYASKAIEEMAKLHALSFAYKNEYLEDFASRYMKLKMTISIPFDDVKVAWAKLAAGAYSVVSEDIKTRLEKFLKHLCTEDCFFQYYGPGKWEQIIHGDYRTSNLLHKVENGQMSLIPIDYQTLRLGTPAYDLLYFIYSGTDAEFRANHLDQLLDHYYSTFSKFLSILNLDPKKVYSRKDFDDDFKHMLPAGLATAIFLLPIVMVEAQNAPNLGAENAGLDTFAIEPNESFKKRFNDIVNDFLRWEVI